jgi:biotin transport system substrate-specific component
MDMETIINKELISDKRLCRLLAVGIFITLTSLSAFVRIPLPFTPVPLTLQTFFVLLSGALLGRKLGVVTQVAYMFLGLTGQQVFTGSGSGSLYLLGPTGGYIVGFVLASFFAGSFLIKDKLNLVVVFMKLLAADFIILFSGTLWLKVSLSCPLSKALLLGFLPFVLGDILKVALATVVYNKIRARVKAAIF